MMAVGFSGALDGSFTGDLIGASIGGMAGLAGGFSGTLSGLVGLADALQQQQQQRLQVMQNMQDLVFQQQMNLQSQQFGSLLAGPNAVPDPVMGMLPHLGGSAGGSPRLFPPVRLTGPDFVRAAAAIAWTARVNSIALLQVHPGSGLPLIQTLAAALSSLRVFFTAKANVFLYFPARTVSTALRQQLQMACGAKVTVNPTPYQQVQVEMLLPHTWGS